MKLKRINILIKYTVSLTILFLLIFQFSFEDLLSVKIKLTYKIILLTILALSLSLFCRALRWYLLMNNQNIKFTLLNSFKLLFVGNALNIILPAGLGDILKSYFGYLWSGVKERMLSVSISDKLIAIGSLFFISVFSFAFHKNLSILFAGVICMLPLLILMLSRLNALCCFLEKIFIKVRLEKFLNISFSKITANFDFTTRKLSLLILLSVAAWVITYYLLFLSFVTVGIRVPFVQVLVFAPLLTLIRLFPLTLNGIGSDEVAIVYLFSQYESSNSKILIGALIYRIILMIIPAIVGVIIIFTTKRITGNSNDK